MSILVGKDFFHYVISGMPSIGKSKLSKKLSELSGRQVLSVDSILESSDFLGMSIADYITFEQNANDLSSEEAWINFKINGSRVIEYLVQKYYWNPSIIDLGGSDLVPQVLDIKSALGKEIASFYANKNLELLRRNGIVMCVHPYQNLLKCENFFLGVETKHKPSRPLQAGEKNPNQDLLNRLRARHSSYLNACDFRFYTKGRKADKDDIPTEIFHSFVNLETQKLRN